MRVLPFHIAKVVMKQEFFRKGDLKVEGSENIPDDDDNVLVVMNHTTYYMEGAAFLYHLWQISDRIRDFSHKFNTVVEYNSLKKKSFNPWRGFVNGISRSLGMIYLKRNTSKKMSEEERRKFNKEAFQEIFDTLDTGWVLFFPQGTTSEGAPLRKGILKIIEEKNPKILPIKTHNFRDAFGKKGVRLKSDFKKELKLSIKPVIENPNQYTSTQIMELLKENLEL